MEEFDVISCWILSLFFSDSGSRAGWARDSRFVRTLRHRKIETSYIILHSRNHSKLTKPLRLFNSNLSVMPELLLQH